MMYHLASGNARYSACSPGTPLYLEAASPVSLLTTRVIHEKAAKKVAGVGHCAQPAHDGLEKDRTMSPSPVHGLSSIIGAHPRQAPPVKPTAAGRRLRAIRWLPSSCGSDFEGRLQRLQVVLCCLVQRAPVPLPPVLLSPPPLLQVLRSPAVLQGCGIATLAEPRSPQRMPPQSRQQSPPWRLLLPCSSSLLCTPAAGRRGCRLALGRWLRLGLLLLVASRAAGHISAAHAGTVGGRLLLKFCVQRLQALPHRRRHINNGHIRAAACTGQLL